MPQGATNGRGRERHRGGYGLRAVAPPIHLTSTYTFEGLDRARAYDYSRAGNPTRDVLADTLAQLEAGAGSCRHRFMRSENASTPIAAARQP